MCTTYVNTYTYMYIYINTHQRQRYQGVPANEMVKNHIHIY